MAININILLILWIASTLLLTTKSKDYNIILAIISGYLIFVLKVSYYV